MRNLNSTCKYFLIFLCTFICNIKAQSQIYNKDVKAIIKIEQTSEFIDLTSIAENLTDASRSVRYKFMAFKTDANNNKSKSDLEGRFFLEGSEKKILTDFSININENAKTIVVLLLYDLDDKVIGQDRIVFNINGKGEVKIDRDEKKVITARKNSNDQESSLEDGFLINGLVIHKMLTRPGREFYREFYSQYYNRAIITPKNIYIKEIPGQRRSTMIVISVENTEVAKFFSRPDKKYIKKMASYAMAKCIGHLQKLKRGDFIRY